ncbi:MAG TPA: phosphatidylserine/phosphatidylglycerophosphate/cardiolipin synthase family protein [Thermoanaerobaculia bacterium]|nr:phosphatidylserine/phosphatidylglycerophosphate/cardiolipin synthase family protein [Thermoanaerobaculia bacterium]
MRRIAIAVALTLATSMRADAVRILDDPQDALQARVDVIQQAQKDVGLLYFLARNDRVTLGVLSLLCDARRRGVPRVRVIVDGSFHRIPKAVLAHLRDEGVEIRVYHPMQLRHPSWWFRRMHEKVVIVDSARYITGGRNLGEAYFGLAKKKNYVDRDVYVDGASAVDASEHFEELWSSIHVYELHVRVSDEEKKRAAVALSDALNALQLGGVIERDTHRDWSDGAIEADAVQFLDDDDTRVGVRVSEAIGAARKSIVIESPYFVPSKSLRTLLEKKLRDGVEVTVLTNSLRSTDGLLPQAAYLKYRRRLARAGVAFREFKGPDALHAKSIIIDGKVTLIGSYNIDPRSQYLNTEVMCLAEDEELARTLRASIDGHVEHAWAIQRAARGGPRISRAMSLRLWAVRLLLPVIEPQL